MSEWYYWAFCPFRYISDAGCRFKTSETSTPEETEGLLRAHLMTHATAEVMVGKRRGGS